jgi:hypothetical protein
VICGNDNFIGMTHVAGGDKGELTMRFFFRIHLEKVFFRFFFQPGCLSDGFIDLALKVINASEHQI